MSERPGDDEKSLFVLLDTNAWQGANFLHSLAGESLVNFLVRTKSKLILPEIVEREVRRQYESELRSNVDIAKSALEKIRSLTDTATHFKEPTPVAAAREAVDKLLARLDPVLERPPFTHEHSLFALDMIMAKLPPCGSENEQFRDCCIWRDCIEYGKQRKMLFVSDDTGFYKGRKHENGLAENLKHDLETKSSSVQIFRNLTKLYETLEPAELKADTEAITAAILPRLEGELVSLVQTHAFTKTTNEKHTIELRRTHLPTERFVSFEFEFPLSEELPGDTQRLNPILTVRGSCGWNVTGGQLSDLKLDQAIISWTNITGQRIFSTTHYNGMTRAMLVRPAGWAGPIELIPATAQLSAGNAIISSKLS